MLMRLSQITRPFILLRLQHMSFATLWDIKWCTCGISFQPSQCISNSSHPLETVKNEACCDHCDFDDRLLGCKDRGKKAHRVPSPRRRVFFAGVLLLLHMLKIICDNRLQQCVPKTLNPSTPLTSP